MRGKEINILPLEISCGALRHVPVKSEVGIPKNSHLDFGKVLKNLTALTAGSRMASPPVNGSESCGDRLTSGEPRQSPSECTLSQGDQRPPECTLSQGDYSPSECTLSQENQRPPDCTLSQGDQRPPECTLSQGDQRPPECTLSQGDYSPSECTLSQENQTRDHQTTGAYFTVRRGEPMPGAPQQPHSPHESDVSPEEDPVVHITAHLSQITSGRSFHCPPHQLLANSPDTRQEIRHHALQHKSSITPHGSTVAYELIENPSRSEYTEVHLYTRGINQCIKYTKMEPLWASLNVAMSYYHNGEHAARYPRAFSSAGILRASLMSSPLEEC
ncbi:unnamed protein product [Arctogadus glacialis]